MMKKQLTIEELKQEFIKARQYESPDCTTKIEDFLLPHLSEAEKQELRVDLEQWIAAEEEFVKSVRSRIDLSELWRERIAPGLMNMLSSPKQDDLWETAIRLVRSASGNISGILLGIWWSKLEFGSGTLSAGTLMGADQGSSEVYQLTGGPLAGTEIKLESGDRLFIRLPTGVSEGSQPQFVDREGKPLELPVIYGPDPIGEVVCDLSGVEELPSFEIQFSISKK